MALPDGATIRRGVPAEAEALAQLHIDAWDDAYTGLMPPNSLIGVCCGVAVLRSPGGIGHSACRCAVGGGRMA